MSINYKQSQKWFDIFSIFWTLHFFVLVNPQMRRGFIFLDFLLPERKVHLAPYYSCPPKSHWLQWQGNTEEVSNEKVAWKMLLDSYLHSFPINVWKIHLQLTIFAFCARLMGTEKNVQTQRKKLCWFCSLKPLHRTQTDPSELSPEHNSRVFSDF